MLKKGLRTSGVNVGFLKSEHSRFQELEIILITYSSKAQNL